MSQGEFPQGWDEERVRAVIEHYERQTEDEAVAEYLTASARREMTAEYGPHDHLVSEVAEEAEDYDKDGD